VIITISLSQQLTVEPTVPVKEAGSDFPEAKRQSVVEASSRVGYEIPSVPYLAVHL
jgi:hypothetical protein